MTELANKSIKRNKAKQTKTRNRWANILLAQPISYAVSHPTRKSNNPSAEFETDKLTTTLVASIPNAEANSVGLCGDNVVRVVSASPLVFELTRYGRIKVPHLDSVSL